MSVSPPEYLHRFQVVLAKSAASHSELEISPYCVIYGHMFIRSSNVVATSQALIYSSLSKASGLRVQVRSIFL